MITEEIQSDPTDAEIPPVATEESAALVDPDDLLKDLPELQDCVKGLAKYFMGLDKFPRRQEVMEARRQRYYLRGDQYIYWKSDSVGFIIAASGQSVSLGADSDVEIPRYTDVYNIYTPYGESLISTLISNPPGINWQPGDLAKAEDVSASQTAEKFQQKIENDNDRKSLQSDVARLFYTDGRTVLYTRRVPTADKSSEYALITAHGVLENKVVPITANCREDLVFSSVSEEISVYKAKADHSTYKAHIKEGSASLGESAYERIARLGVLGGTSSLSQGSFSHMTTRHYVFLRPSTFDKAEEKFREDLTRIFPNGIKATFCGDAYCGSSNISMDEELTIRFPSPGDGMNRPSLGKRMVPLQDVFNDELNLWHEAHDHCVPTLYMYSETGDIDAVRDQANSPGNIIPFTSLPPGASTAASAFYASVLEAIPETLPKFIMFLQGPLAQFISGAFPALFGGDTGDNDTAKGISIQRDQAMGRMGLPWGFLQELFAGAYLQAVKSEAKYGNEDAKFNYSVKNDAGNIVNEELAIADLKRGNFKCVPDMDSSFPETTNAKRASYQTIMAASGTNPILAEIMAQPANLQYGHDVMGLDLVVPGAEARTKQLIEIDQLLKENPVPPSMDDIKALAMKDPILLQKMADWEKQAQEMASQGQEPPAPPITPDMMNPSVPIDPECDFNQYEWQTVQDWLSSPARRKEEEKGNFKGVMNVRLHGLKHQQAVIAAATAMAPPGPPPPGGPETPTDKNATAQSPTAPPAQ